MAAKHLFRSAFYRSLLIKNEHDFFAGSFQFQRNR